MLWWVQSCCVPTRRLGPSDGGRRLYQGRLYTSPSSPPLHSHSVARFHPSSSSSSCRRRNSADSIYNFLNTFSLFLFHCLVYPIKSFINFGNFVFKALDTCFYRNEEQVCLICFFRIFVHTKSLLLKVYGSTRT